MTASASPPKKRTNQRIEPHRQGRPRCATLAKPVRMAIYDVIVAGGGPAGSTLAWKLASQGLKILVFERTKFPREKVCGDFVEPRGLRILGQMGALGALEAHRRSPLRIRPRGWILVLPRSSIIPFYGVHRTLLPHGYIRAAARPRYSPA